MSICILTVSCIVLICINIHVLNIFFLYSERHPNVSIEKWKQLWLDLRKKEKAEKKEERADDGLNLPGHLAAHIVHPDSHLHGHSQPLFSTLSVRFC